MSKSKKQLTNGRSKQINLPHSTTESNVKQTEQQKKVNNPLVLSNYAKPHDNSLLLVTLVVIFLCISYILIFTKGDFGFKTDFSGKDLSGEAFSVQSQSLQNTVNNDPEVSAYMIKEDGVLKLKYGIRMWDTTQEKTPELTTYYKIHSARLHKYVNNAETNSVPLSLPQIPFSDAVEDAEINTFTGEYDSFCSYEHCQETVYKLELKVSPDSQSKPLADGEIPLSTIIIQLDKNNGYFYETLDSSLPAASFLTGADVNNEALCECPSEETACQDSDYFEESLKLYGKDVYYINLNKKGTIQGISPSTGKYVTEMDHCVNGKIEEYFCSNSIIALTTYPCPSKKSCIDGACVDQPPLDQHPSQGEAYISMFNEYTGKSDKALVYIYFTDEDNLNSVSLPDYGITYNCEDVPGCEAMFELEEQNTLFEKMCYNGCTNEDIVVEVKDSNGAKYTAVLNKENNFYNNTNPIITYLSLNANHYTKSNPCACQDDPTPLPPAPGTPDPHLPTGSIYITPSAAGTDGYNLAQFKLDLHDNDGIKQVIFPETNEVIDGITWQTKSIAGSFVFEKNAPAVYQHMCYNGCTSEEVHVNLIDYFNYEYSIVLNKENNFYFNFDGLGLNNHLDTIQQDAEGNPLTCSCNNSDQEEYAFKTAQNYLLSHWNFDNDDNAAGIVVDSVSGIDGSANGQLVYEKGVKGKGLKFVDTTAFAEIPNPTNGLFNFGTTNFSISVWTKLTSSTETDTGIFSKGLWGAPRATGFGLLTESGGKIRFEAGKFEYVLSPSINDGKWHNIIGVKQGKELLMYVDGVQTTTKTLANSNDITNVQSVTFGQRGKGAGVFNGYVDEIKIYNQALSEEIVQTIYENDNKTNDVGFNADPEMDLNKGLIRYWNFDLLTADNKVIDVITNSGGEVYGASVVNGKLGNALDFSTGNYVYIPPHTTLNIKNEITMTSWVKPKSYPSDWNLILTKGNQGVLRNYGIWLYKSGALVSSYYSGGFKGFPSGNYQNNLEGSEDGWYHVASVIDTEKGYRANYVNGMLVAEENAALLPMLINDQPLYIGSGSGVWQFNGSIDEVRIYNRKLSNEEVNALYLQEQNKADDDSDVDTDDDDTGTNDNISNDNNTTGTDDDNDEDDIDDNGDGSSEGCSLLSEYCPENTLNVLSQCYVKNPDGTKGQIIDLCAENNCDDSEECIKGVCFAVQENGNYGDDTSCAVCPANKKICDQGVCSGLQDFEICLETADDNEDGDNADDDNKNSDGVDDADIIPKVGGACTSTEGCLLGLKCVNNKCEKTICVEDADCPLNSECAAVTSTEGAETKECKPLLCQYNSECGLGLVCASGSCKQVACETGCPDFSECSSGEIPICKAAGCTSDLECGSAFKCVEKTCSKVVCTNDADCPANSGCFISKGICSANACANDADCSGNYYCVKTTDSSSCKPMYGVTIVPSEPDDNDDLDANPSNYVGKGVVT